MNYLSVLMVLLSIPLVAILSDMFLKARRMQYERDMHLSASEREKELEKEVERLASQQRVLEERVRNLETIALAGWETKADELLEAASRKRLEQIAKGLKTPGEGRETPPNV